MNTTKRNFFGLAYILALPLLILGCQQQAPLAVVPARLPETQKITLGTVQKKVQVGKSSDEVLSAMGSPNIITKNSSDDTETWVYDKIMTESERVEGNNATVNVLSTRTLIVVIKFDRSQLVEKVTYRQTSY